MKLDVYQIGSAVLVGTPDDPIAATVAAVCVRGEAHSVQYECVWWDGKTRTTNWVDENEVRPAGKDAKKTSIGFARDGE